MYTGDPHIDGDHHRLMQTVRRQQEAHEDPLKVSEVDSCEFVSLKCVQTCLDVFMRVCTCLYMFVRVIEPLPVFPLHHPPLRHSVLMHETPYRLGVWPWSKPHASKDQSIDSFQCSRVAFVEIPYKVRGIKVTFR
jgi:hypothetical protein